MIWKLQYCILICLLVTIVTFTTGEERNSTVLPDETTTTPPQENAHEIVAILQEDSQKYTTKPTETFIQCSEAEVNFTELFKCQKSKYFKKLAKKLQSPEDEYSGTQYWMTCWMNPCFDEVNTFKYLDILQIISRKNGVPLRKNLIHGYSIGLVASKKAIEYLESVKQFFEKFLVSQNDTLRDMNNTAQLDNYTGQSACQYLSPDCTTDLNRKYVDFINLLSELNAINIYRQYVHPTIYVLIFCTGLVWNGALIFMFIRNKDLRIIPNTMLINNAVNDMLLLLLAIPLQYYMYDYNLYQIKDKYLTYNISFQTTLTFVSASSVLAMSIQRYLAITRSLSKQASSLSNNPRRYVIVNILAVWLSSAGAALLLFFTTSYNIRRNGKIAWENFLGHILITVFVTIALTVVNILTAIKLKNSAKDIPGESAQSKLLRTRYRSSNIIMALTVVFWFTHGIFLLQNIFKFLAAIQYFNYIHGVAYYLFFSTTFLNPIALCVSSTKFRTLFKKHLWGWTIKLNKPM